MKENKKISSWHVGVSAEAYAAALGYVSSPALCA